MSDRRQASYLFHGQTTSLCETCHRPIPAKIISEEGSVFHLKRCPTHGTQKRRISSDLNYWRRCGEYLKPGDRPLRLASRTEHGCPFDCGLCPDHEQHSCLALIEINEACNLSCPVCFADSSVKRTRHRPLDEVIRMLDAIVEAEGEPDLVQLSGGEPTLHPQLFEILDAAKARPIRHLMINTNGIRIATDPEFVARLAGYMPRFEIYLQFDSLERDPLMALRGADLREIHQRALEALDRHQISTTLVVTVKKGLNDREIGAIIDHALSWRCVRGVTLQPIQDCGRNEGYDLERDRALLSDVRNAVIEQTEIFGDGDMIPLPCNPYQISIGYGLKAGGKVVSLGSLVPREVLLAAVPNTVSFENDLGLRRRVFELLNLSAAAGDASQKLAEVLCCLPRASVPESLRYEDTFRVVIIEFLDATNFCVANVKRSCVHFVQPDGQIIPFDTFNLFYRDGAPRSLRDRVMGELALGPSGRPRTATHLDIVTEREQ